MRVLQTLGRHKKTHQEGIFQYRRDAEGVYVDLHVGQASSLPADWIRFPHDDWTKMLNALGAKGVTFRLTASGSVPADSVYETLKQSGVKPCDATAGTQVNWHDSYCAAVAAILEHEGSLDLYAGGSGPIQLARDF